jgi:hypothetical protein
VSGADTFYPYNKHEIEDGNARAARLASDTKLENTQKTRLTYTGDNQRLLSCADTFYPYKKHEIEDGNARAARLASDTKLENTQKTRLMYTGDNEERLLPGADTFYL